MTGDSFSRCLVQWQQQHGRHDLPWQGTRDAYRIWVSEIMLQQTQVSAVIPYFLRFMQRFPSLSSLAAATEEDVLAHWAGLGYYARGRNLHRAARQMMERHGGKFPADSEAILELPGVGRSTAAAIGAFAFGQRQAILDGNVKRVLTRAFGIAGWPGDKRVEAGLWALAESLLPEQDIETYTQALMDLGATLCTRGKPICKQCPLADRCIARAEDRIASLPETRPKKPLPQRATTLLLIRHAGDIYLEKRPAPGIWGGLWCLPESPANVDETCRQLTGQLPARHRQLPVFTHAFTHFRLEITPLEMWVEKPVHGVQEARAIWMDVAEAVHAAVPKPVKTLLQGLLRCT